MHNCETSTVKNTPRTLINDQITQLIKTKRLKALTYAGLPAELSTFEKSLVKLCEALKVLVSGDLFEHKPKEYAEGKKNVPSNFKFYFKDVLTHDLSGYGVCWLDYCSTAICLPLRKCFEKRLETSRKGSLTYVTFSLRPQRWSYERVLKELGVRNPPKNPSYLDVANRVSLMCNLIARKYGCKNTLRVVYNCESSPYVMITLGYQKGKKTVTTVRKNLVRETKKALEVAKANKKNKKRKAISKRQIDEAKKKELSAYLSRFNGAGITLEEMQRYTELAQGKTRGNIGSCWAWFSPKLASKKAS